MGLGLITDVHNHAAELTAALAAFRDRGVTRVVAIGDTCDAFARVGGAGEVAELLRGCGAVGVWGNHDFTLCHDVDDDLRGRYPPAVFEVMAGMRPRLVIGECHFSHKESSVDPHDVAQLWDVEDGPRDLVAKAGRAFGAVDSRLQFVGHYHRWWAATPDGPVDWSGGGSLHFDPGRRYFVVVAAVCDGWCGVLDTAAGVLAPIRLG